ncbi:hypothetical protein CLV30_12040 [Haloactinopolyspora alba]|uniref:Molecular chaperone Hsp90 n=1 Tax=Haloactinopolyspora alba TaxID=648780 RepID=A0A2P8DM23_9ACTN|nr:hypothetical protein [Haloactinopolyspora alba]PSK98254.1 hypothetical protein CLV30_12040 [Haloactinopolyspora alba]
MDVFDTAALRTRVLAAWAASPARFREDANAEDELARGAYRDRVIVELAQNAADAGTRAGEPARLLLRLDGRTLVAANTGAPLDSAGVEGLSTLRASGKRGDGAVGRFGVGFAAVLAVSDEPALVSADGGVRWSRTDAHAAAASVGEIADELDVRGTALPVLRLPFPLGPGESSDLPDGYDTAVLLPLRDDDAERLVRRLLADVDDALLLALPDLAEIVIETDGERRELRGGPSTPVPGGGDGHAVTERRIGERTWRLCTTSGTAPAEALAERPFEERMRPGWSASVAVPVHDGLPVPAPAPPAGVVHAPTPTDDRTELPALVIASLPLDSQRRRVAPGRLTDELVERLGEVYAALVASFAPAGSAESGRAVLSLVPGPLGTGDLDAGLHRAVRAALGETPFVPSADGARMRPRDVVLVDGLGVAADPQALAAVIGGLPASGWWNRDVLTGLGAAERALADVVDELSALRLDPSGWRELYAALDGADREALGSLPVPLADGRTVRGPRGLLLPGDVDPALMAPFALRVVAPEAAHPLLRRLGAVEASPASVLRDPQVGAAVAQAADDDADPWPVAEAVLGLVAEAGVTVADEPWLTGLLLPDDTGTPVPAGELLLPDSPVLAVLDGDPAEFTVASDVVRRFGDETVTAVGVRRGFDVVTDADAPLDADLWHDLDDEDGWAEAASARVPDDEPAPVVTEFVGVRDLDLVREDRWSEVLPRLADDPAARAAVVEPTMLLLAGGGRVPVPSYTAWWLHRHARVGGTRLRGLCASTAEPVLRSLLPVAEVGVDDAFATAVGLARTVDDVDADLLLERLADDDVVLDAAQLARVYESLARRDPVTVTPPASVRVPDGTGTRVLAAGDAVVCDAPYWLQLGRPEALPAPAALADVLDLDLASEVWEGRVTTAGRRRPVPDVARAVLAQAPSQYGKHDDLRVDDVSVGWWVEGDTVHASTLDGLARGIAWVTGRWDRRWLLAEVLRDPAAAPGLVVEDAYE